MKIATDPNQYNKQDYKSHKKLIGIHEGAERWSNTFLEKLNFFVQ